ncbi:MAG: patatin-like phospholipase family protein [Saprospiraceae bacterium]
MIPITKRETRSTPFRGYLLPLRPRFGGWGGIAVVLYLAFPCAAFAQAPAPAKIGLTLSGGGAKGLAHIGILKALDSAGVRVDYVTGTSMGSIIGSLYAVGYSGKEIESLARNLDWKTILSNQVSIREISMEEKESYGRHALEIPFEKGRFQVPTGALESQELWLKLSELYFPAYAIKDFDRLPRPFRAVATDVVNGKPVILDKGEIITAVRASMAIPGLFTAVELEGRRLVDGGVVRNLPVGEAREMGAGFVIASNVGEGKQEKEHLTNPLQILTQIVFFKESEDKQHQVARSDLYIDHPLTPYSMGSFDRASAIIDSGIAMGQQFYPAFRRLADSLRAPSAERPVLPRPDSVFIASAKVEGLENELPRFFLKSLGLVPQRYYTAVELSAMIRRRFGNLSYDRIHYRLEPLPGNQASIVFEVEESPPAAFQFNVPYNSFLGLGLLASATAHDFLPNARSSLSILLGENPRFKVEHLQYIGRQQRTALAMVLQSEAFQVTGYENHQATGLYKLNNLRLDARLQSGSHRRRSYGLGTRYERVGQTPATPAAYQAEGRNAFLTSYGFYQRNTLDKIYYPQHGVQLHAEIGRVYGQDLKLRYLSNGAEVEVDPSLIPSAKPFAQAFLNAAWYRALSEKYTFSGLFQAGWTSGASGNLFNAFYIGGMDRLYRNQIVFPGIPNYGDLAYNVAALQVGLRRQIARNFLLIARSNLLVRDFGSRASGRPVQQVYSGHSLTLAYPFLTGPVEFSAMVSEKSKGIQTYVSIGFSF